VARRYKCRKKLTWLWEASLNTDTTCGLVVWVLSDEVTAPGKLFSAACTISGCNAEVLDCSAPEAARMLFFVSGCPIGGLRLSAVLVVKYLQGCSVSGKCFQPQGKLLRGQIIPFQDCVCAGGRKVCQCPSRSRVLRTATSASSELDRNLAVQRSKHDAHLSSM